MKRWQIGLNIIYEIVTFLGTALLLVIFLPKLLGFFWPFVASWILALLAAPLCSFLEKRIRLNKKWASALIIIVVLLILAGLGYLIITKLGREMISFLSDAPEYYYYFQNAVRLLGEKLNDIVTPISEEFGNQIQTVFNDLLRQIGTIVNNFAPGAVEMMGSAAANITNGLVGTLVMILSAYFFIAEREKLSVQWMKLIPEDARKQVGSIWKKLMEALGGFLMAQFKIMFVIFLILLAGLILLRNPYAFFLALLISFLDLLPVLGTGTVLLPWTLVVFLRGGIRQGVILVVLYFVCLLTRQLLQPKIIGDSIGMETLPTLFLIYTGFKLKGMGGMILFLLLGTVAVSLYRLGLFDRKLQRMKRLIREYRKQGNRVG